MAETRPTGEQISFRSSKTGTHVLDTYMENVEQGTRTLADMIEDLFDSSGTFRSGNFEFRFNETDSEIEFRVGNFASPSTGWQDLTTFFNITGTFSTSTTYDNFDVVTVTNKDVYIVHGLSSGSTFASESAFTSSSNTTKLVDVSEAREWASKTTGQVQSTDYSAKAYAIGGTGLDSGDGSAKDWAIKTSSTVGNTGEYSAKYWATSTNVTTVANGIANINTVATDISNVNTVATNIANVNKVAAIDSDVTDVAAIDTNVTTVAGIDGNVTTVAGISANVTTVAGISANVTTVAGISSDVTTVANNDTDVSTVATNISDLQTVADEIDNNNLQTVAADIQAVVDVADDLNEATSEIDTVANAIDEVNDVGTNISSVVTVAGNISNVNTAATDIANINTLAGISANVTTVAGISSNVTMVANNDANITTLAGINTDITTVAGIDSDVTTVAGISADVTTAATNVTAFNQLYLGAQSSAPTQDPDGSALDIGDLYFDTTSDTMKVYASGGWTNAGSSVNGTADRFVYTATANQTTFTGADDASNTLAYDAGYLDVYMNGVKLRNGASHDFTASNGTSIVLASGAAANDTIEIIAYGTFTLSNQSIDDMTDVTTSGITDGQFLKYVSANSRFEPATVQTDVSADSSPQLGANLDTNGNNVLFGDNDKAKFGDGGDLEIYHDGSHSYIKDDGGTGNLRIWASNLEVSKGNGAESYIQAASNGAVDLYYDGSKKLATTSSGVDITGSLTTDGIVSSEDITIREAIPQLVLEDTDLTDVRGSVVQAGTNLLFRSRGGTSTHGGVQWVRNNGTDTKTLEIEPDGDIAFYADDGTTKGLFWDASTERLGVGTISPEDTLEVNGTIISGAAATSGGPVFAQTYGDNGPVGTGDYLGVISSHASSGAFKIGYGLMATSSESNASAYNNFSGGRSAVDFNQSTITFRNDTANSTTAVGSAVTTQQLLQLGRSEAVFNNDGNDIDFRVESNSQAHALFVNAGNDSIYFGHNSTNPYTPTEGTNTGASISTAGQLYTSVNSATHGHIFNRASGTGTLITIRHAGSDKGSITVTSSGTTYSTTSDRRLKTDIHPIEHATEKLMAMNAVTHRWIADPEDDPVHGFIAQEMQEIVPEAVSGSPDSEDMMSMDYGRITPVLVAALQDAHRKIESLEARINEMENK